MLSGFSVKTGLIPRRAFGTRRAGAVISVAATAAAMLFTPAPSGAETLTVRSANPFNFVAALSDPASGGPVELSVELRLPAAAGGPVPAVVFVHGAGGPLGHHAVWRELFDEIGVATAHANHFQPRGKSSAVGGHIQLTGAAMAVDALNILKALADDPRIDAERIAIMGASKGGGVSLYTAWKPLQRAIAPGHRFAAHIALYPTCMHWDRPDPTGAPILVLVGADDNWTGVDQCRESVEWFRKAGHGNVDIKIYPGALHGFDSRPERREIMNAYSVVNCRFSIGPDGKDYGNGVYMDSPAAKRAALGGCIKRGVVYGGDPGALRSAKADVRRFIGRLFTR
jgi:dienelactone hydrolase